MTAIRKELDKPDFPAPRLLVYVPQKADRMEFDADFATDDSCLRFRSDVLS